MGKNQRQMNKHKNFIKEYYNGKYGSMCADWKGIIETHYPEFKESEQFKVGDWVVCWEAGIITRPEEEQGGNFLTSFVDGGTQQMVSFKNIKRKATPQEIEAHLIAEAKRRYKKGDSIKCLYSGAIKILEEAEPGKNQSNSDSEFWHNGTEGKNCQVYKDGIWAEILETITKAEAEKQLGKKIV